MADNNLRELSRQLRAAQNKYTYFLLAAAASGVALAVNQTHESAISWSMLPLGLAVMSWASSFFLGCKYVLD